MTTVSYHASHEQFTPSDLLGLATEAETAGFDAVFCSDHIQPWAPEQGHSGHTWTWLGAALQATRHVTFSTITVPGGWRYHPVVLAHAIATLGQMFPGRMPWLAFGSGEAVNERLVGTGWPTKADRNQRLQEGVSVVRALLAGETVNHRGLLSVEEARLWDRPAVPPQLFGAATSEVTARWLGGFADGLLTLGRDLNQLRGVIAAFREGGGAGKPVHVKLDVSWAPDRHAALSEAHRHWRFNALCSEVNCELRQPEHFAAAARFVQPADLEPLVLITDDITAIAAHVAACSELGVQAVDVHQVGLTQRPFIEAFGERALPALRKR